jgi:cbb3-type cytochrome oxidase subunit 3
MPDARSFIGIGVFALTVMILWMMKEDSNLRGDEFFQTIATVIIANGLMAVIAWAYAATKGGGEQAAKNAVIAEKLAGKDTQKVEVVNKPSDPVPTTDNGSTEELPPYAQP